MRKLSRLFLWLLATSMLLLAYPSETYAQQKGKQTPAATSRSRQNASRPRSNRQRNLSRQAYEKQQRDLQRQIKDTELLISNNKQSVRSQSRDIRIREDEIRKRQALINSKQQEIETIIAEEDSLRREIRHLQRSHDATVAKYAVAIRHLYKWRSGYNELLFILSASDLLEAMRRVRYLRQYSDWRKQQAELLTHQRVATEETKATLAQTRTDHENVLRDIDQQRSSLAQKQQEQQEQILELQKRNVELEAELRRDRQQMAEVERKIQRIIEEEIRKAEEERKRVEAEERKKQEQEAARRKANEERRHKAEDQKKAEQQRKEEQDRRRNNRSETPSTESQTIPERTLTLRNTEEARKLSGSFTSNKGRLPYPLDANFAFVDHYNQASNGNSSIVLSTRVGAHACAIYEGVVQSCFPTSEEWTVIVRHGNYRSVYMNLKNVLVKTGQHISTRQPIGTLKPEPDGNRAELRFWIYQNSTPVNPERWLKR